MASDPAGERRDRALPQAPAGALLAVVVWLLIALGPILTVRDRCCWRGWAIRWWTGGRSALAAAGVGLVFTLIILLGALALLILVP